MTTPINTFQDILDAMERDPALLDALRRHILTDDLLELPAQVKALAETLKTLTETVNDLSETVKVLVLDNKATKAEMARMSGRLSNLLGTDYENTVARYTDRLVRRNLSVRSPAVVARAKGANATLPFPAGDQAAEAGRISWDEADDLALADVIVAGLTDEGRDVFVVAEISMTVQQRDRGNAVRRADILQRATGTTTIPVTIGISQELPAQAPAPAFIACDPEQPFAG